MLRLNRKVFFNHIRKSLFRGRISQSQVDGMNDLLDAWEQYGTDDPRHLAYAAATSYHETGSRMQPVREGFAKTDSEARRRVARLAEKRGQRSAVVKYARPAGEYGHVYYGRGDVQLTWIDNYRRMERITGLPLVKNPDLALKHSKRILIEGMTKGASNRGDFTRYSVETFFNDRTDDPVGARKVVNGTDRATLIAGYHAAFLEAITYAVKAYEEPGFLDDEDDADPPRRLPRATDWVGWGIGLSGTGGFGLAVRDWFAENGDALTGGLAFVVVVGLILAATGRLKITKETGQ